MSVFWVFDLAVSLPPLVFFFLSTRNAVEAWVARPGVGSTTVKLLKKCSLRNKAFIVVRLANAILATSERKSIICVFGAFSLEYPHQLWILLCGFYIFWASRPVYMIFTDNDDHVVTTSSSREKWAALVGLVGLGWWDRGGKEDTIWASSM